MSDDDLIDTPLGPKRMSTIIKALHYHDELVDVANKAHPAFAWLALKAKTKEDREEFKRREDQAWTVWCKARGEA